MNEILIYQKDNGSQVSVSMDGETIWLTQRQLSELLDTSTDNIGLHLKNIFASGELHESAPTEDFSVVQKEGNRNITRVVRHYNLDAIISVGYRVNSKRGTQFRQWATRVLREHLTQGFSIDRQRFESNASELEAALELVRRTAQSPDLSEDAGRGLVEIVSRYTQTFLLLQRYDEGLLKEPSGTKGGTLPSISQVRKDVAVLKKDLMARGEASDLFAQERGDALVAILGNLDQTILGEPAYPTIESKAAHLLYFVIKNHPLADGNKRTGAFLFVDFLHRNHALIRDGQVVINDIGLAALALLVAESAPNQMATMIRLIENMLAQVA
ncbi:MAG: virulence protein RhuM/Fic/DOC family protein [Ottowia sp.]|nr:virulence protein RhuM/Fic/DOC family protein [Ottowia sp.]